MNHRNNFLQRALQGDAQRQANMTATQAAQSMADIGKLTGQMVAAHYHELLAGGVPDDLAKSLLIEYQKEMTGMLSVVMTNELAKR